MIHEERTVTGGLNPLYQQYERQQCFVGYSQGASWHEDLVAACSEVLEEFDMEPWYATEHFAPTQSLREKVVELIANTRYGMYDLSSWRKDEKSEWVMPRNVFIELGIAIALNRPLLLLRHASNRAAQLLLPTCLEGVSTSIVEYTGLITLKRALRERLSQWKQTSPEHDWWNRYCTFGNRVCMYREMHPHLLRWEGLRCHISDGQDIDRDDFHAIVEEVLKRFDDVTFSYLDHLSLAQGYSFLLCSHCQTVRSAPFAIYRISSHTPAETFIAIGISLALETQFEHKIPKILLTASTDDIPSLLAGYDVVVAQSDRERLTSLRKFTPSVIHQVRKSTWKARPLPFIEAVPYSDKQIDSSDEQSGQKAELEEGYIKKIGKYGLVAELGKGELTVTYRVLDTESNQLYAMKMLYSGFATDEGSVNHFQRVADILSKLNNPHIVRWIESGEHNNIPYYIMEYVEGQTLRQRMSEKGAMDTLQAFNYVRQIAEGLYAANELGIVHRNIRPQDILIDSQDRVKIVDFGTAREQGADERTNTQANIGVPYYMAPEVLESSRYVSIRSDLYSVATLLFEMLAGQPPFRGGTAVDIALEHINMPVPSLCLLRPDLLGVVDLFIQKAMAKSPDERYQTPDEFVAALDRLHEMTLAAPPGNRTLAPVNGGNPTTQGLPPLIGKTFGQYRIFDYISGGLVEVFKAHLTALDRYAAIKISSTTFRETMPDFDKLFVQETDLIVKLTHPNLVPIYESGMQDGLAYIAAEYIDGGSLRGRLKTGLTFQEAVEYILQAAEGLDYLHYNNLVHQNVSPDQMLLRSNGQLLLSNWELFNIFKAGQISVPDSSLYRPPEQEESPSANPRSDIYSLGISLFECLTGRVPLKTPSGPDTVLPIWQLRSAGVPVSVQQVIVKMTAKQADERYQSMQEVIDALKTSLMTSSGHLILSDRQAVAIGMERCAFCDASTTEEDELCPGCGHRLLPEPLPPPLSQWSSSWGVGGWGTGDKSITVNLGLCPFCGEDTQPGNEICPHCGNRLPSKADPWSSGWGVEKCPFCGAETRPRDNFCLSCGNRLLSATPSGTVQQALSVGEATIPGPEEWGQSADTAPDDISEQPARLILRADNGDSLQEYLLDKPEITIGRAPNCDIPLSNDKLTSRRHATVRFEDGAYMLRDELSANGTFVNGQQIEERTPIELKDDDRISIGEYELIFRAFSTGVHVEDLSTMAFDYNQPAPDITWKIEDSGSPIASNSDLVSAPSPLQEDVNYLDKMIGNYRIMRGIGQGGLGRVYLAEHIYLGRQVAVKLFYSHLSSKQRQNLFFLQTQVLGKLHHPYILPIIDVNLHEQPLYLITEYAPHGSLHDRIQNGQPLPLESVVTIISQIGEALMHIHQHNIIHRDLKPGNILFNERDEALLSDFDIAVMLDEGDSKKVNKWGSPPYMAPEQFRGEVGKLSDQYALGCIAYRLCTGQRPFDDSDFHALQFKHTTQMPIAPQQLNPAVPEHLEQVIIKAMAKAPANRYADMAAFVAALHADGT